jgi:hypothetical protein
VKVSIVENEYVILAEGICKTLGETGFFYDFKKTTPKMSAVTRVF